LILFAVREPPRPNGLRRVKNPLGLAELRSLGGAYWLVVAVTTLFTLARFSEAFLVLRAQNVGLPVSLVPAVLVVMNIVYAAAATPAGALSDRIGRFGILFVGFAMLIVADVVLALVPSLVGLAIGVAAWGLHMGLTQGLLTTLVADAAPPELRGTAFGAFNLFSGVAMLAASVIAGTLWDAGGPQETFLAGAVFTAAAMVGLFAVRSRFDRHLR
jgi:MFS family permease